MDGAEYKHIILRLRFLKYISDSLGEHRATLEKRFGDPKDEYFIEDEVTRAMDLEKRTRLLHRGECLLGSGDVALGMDNVSMRNIH